jgi:hypothetical protein
MFIAEACKIIVALPAIGYNDATGFYGCLYKGLQCRFPPIRHSGETEAACIELAFTFAVWFCEHSDLHGGCNQHLVSNTASFASCSPTQKSLVNLNMTI